MRRECHIKQREIIQIKYHFITIRVIVLEALLLKMKSI